MSIDYKKISAEETYKLRHKVLRPHQKINEMVYPSDGVEGSFHIGAIVDHKIIGILSIFPESKNGEFHQGSWRIRGMAVEDEYRGSGIGKELVQKSIKFVQEQGAASVWCNARSSAIGFYLSLGFKQYGDEFEIKGIGPHYIAQLDL